MDDNTLSAVRKPAVLLFDLGNVFIQVNPNRPIQALQRASGLSFPEILAYFTHGEGITAYETGQQTSAGFYENTKRALHLKLTEPEFKFLWQDMFTPIMPMIAFFREVHREFPCSILSNTNAWHIEYCENNYPFIAEFDHRFYSFQMGAVKPDPRIFIMALTALNTTPENILFIDDRQENIDAAGSLGMQTHLFINAATWVKAWPRFRDGREPRV